jgi:hypothetical protein
MQLVKCNAKAVFAIAVTALFFTSAGQALAVAPTVTIDPDPTASYTTISGTGTVDPGDQEVGVYAEFATDPGGPWGERLVQSIPANAGPTPIAYEITGLTAGTEYFVRLDAWTGDYNLSSVVSATTLPADPPSVAIDPVSAIGPEGAHFSGEVDTATGANPVDAAWRFQCVPACPGLSGGTVSAGDSATVEADATGLLPGTTYEVSLVAEGPGGQQTAGPETFTTLITTPQVSATSVKRQLREATVEGTVNPRGAETTYYFEYGTSTAYGQSTAAETIPAGTAPVKIRAQLHGLTPATGYHVRLVATNVEGTVEGPDRAFVTEAPDVVGNCPNEAIRVEQDSTGLRDCRAYELVSPADKNGFPVHWKPYVGTTYSINGGMIAGARNGETAVFTGWGVFAGSDVSLPQVYRSRRSASGWVTTPGSSAINAHHPEAISPASPLWWTSDYNLTQGLIQTSNAWSPLDDNMFAPNTETTSGPMDAYLRTAADENVLISVNDEGEAVGNLTSLNHPPSIAGNGGHPLFQVSRHVVAEDEGRAEGTYNVYENDGSGPRLVSVAPGGGPADPECGSYLPPVGYNGAVGPPQSADGSKIVFQTSGQLGSENFLCPFVSPSQLYLRIDGERTVPVSESQRSEPDPDGPRAPEYIGASADFSRIFFKSQEMLTDDLPPEGAEYLYEFDVDSEELSAILGSSPRVKALSADGSSFFFERSGTLYQYRDGIVTPIASTTSVTGLERASNPLALVASDDGGSVLFSAAAIAGFPSGGTDQIYLWREGGELQCLSCGKPGSGPPTHAHMSTGDESIAAVAEPGRYADSISADGSLVAFDTEEALSPSDTNRRRDVYEYDVEADRIALVTDGKAEQDAFLLGMSRSGRDVFFTTGAGLVSEDADGTIDLYNARRDGGFLPAAGDSADPCVGEACQPPAALPPAAEAPASSRLDGPGNAKPRRRAACRKQASGKRKKAAQRPKSGCAKQKRKSEGRKGSERRVDVPAGLGKREGK